MIKCSICKSNVPKMEFVKHVRKHETEAHHAKQNEQAYMLLRYVQQKEQLNGHR